MIPLSKITEEVQKNADISKEDLAKVLDKNFDDLNKRDDAVLDGLKDMESRIIRSYSSETKELKSDIQELKDDMKAIKKLLTALIIKSGDDPNLLLED